MDALAALVALTATAGIVASSFSSLYERQGDVEFEKKYAIAGDIANLGITSLSLKKDGTFYSNLVSLDNSFPAVLDAYAEQFRQPLTLTNYRAELMVSGCPQSINCGRTLNGGCSGSEKAIAVARRLLADTSTKATVQLTVRVCS